MVAARKKKKNNNNTHTHPPPHTHTHTIHLKWLVLGEEQWTKNKGVTQYDLAETENLFIHSSLIYSFDTDLQNTWLYDVILGPRNGIMNTADKWNW